MITILTLGMGFCMGAAVGLLADTMFMVAQSRRERLQISGLVPRKKPLRRPF